MASGENMEKGANLSEHNLLVHYESGNINTSVKAAPRFDDHNLHN